MRLGYKILNGVAAFIALCIAGLIVTASYDADCPALAADAPGADSMSAVMNRCYGVPKGVRLERIAKPVPGEGKVLIKVHAASINPVEWYRVTGQPKLLRIPNKIGAPDAPRLGYDMAGVVEAVGPNVTAFKPGDEVFGGAGGALAEYVIAREQGALVAKPENMTFEEAAAIPIAAITALQGLRDQGDVTAGKRVLINGASGGVGTYGVQIAKALGAEVTGVCSTRNVEMVRSIGADHVVDYTKEDFTAGSARYDVILDNVGNQPFGALAGVMNPGGLIVIVGGSKKGPLLGPIKRIAWSKIMGMFIEPEIRFYIADVNKGDLEFLAGLVRAGKMRPVIDRRYPLAETAAALEYLGGGRARGKVVVTVD